MTHATNPSADRPHREWRIVHTESSLGWGGQEHRILAELTGFQRRGHQVWLVAPEESELFRRAARADIRVRAVDFGRSRIVGNILRLSAWLRRERIDVLNPHSSRDSWVAGLAGRLARVPFLVRTRHFDVPIPNPRISRHVYRTLADHLLTTSPKVTDHLRSLFRLPEDRVSTVPTGIDLERFSPGGARAAVVPDNAAGRTLVGMISIIRKAKGHETLLRAARLLNGSGFPVHCLFVGEGPSRSNVEACVRELRLSDHVTFAGHREDVPEVLRALDILALPSLHEGIPQVGLQALAVKVPVIGSDVGGIPSIIRPNQTGRLVLPGDAAALAAAIRETIGDRAATERLCEAGRALVEAEHSLDHMLDRLERLYERHLPR
jgi:glycosyltransferase involved in cell wall biosynthesis